VATSAVALAGMYLEPGRAWLWGLVPYTYLGNSLAPLPYDGYIIALGESHNIWLVVVIGTIGTMIVEAWNMELLARMLARDGTRGFRSHPVTRWAVRWYEKAPFWSLVGTCILPIIPHYPMRILATLARYPMWKYQLTVLVGRGGRYAWLAALGWALKIPVEIIVVASFVLLGLAVRSARKMNRYEEPEAAPAEAAEAGAPPEGRP
jgi:membrane protein YqaA with SNARE-associated domain